MVVHHPVLLPQLIVFIVVVILLIWLHSILPFGEWLVALFAGIVFLGLFVMFMMWLIGRLADKPGSLIGKTLVLQGRSNASEGYVAADVAKKSLIGKTGRALSMLRPAGKVDIAGARVDAVSDGEFIPQGCDVEVMQVEGNRVVVRRTEEKS
jgi:membrane-bound ClpP family serine protease